MTAGKILLFALGVTCLFLSIRWSDTLPFTKIFLVFAIGIILLTLSNISKLASNGILRSSTLVKILYNTKNGQPKNYFMVGYFLIMVALLLIVGNILLTSNTAAQELKLLFKERIILFATILIIIILIHPLLFKIKLEQIIVTTKRQNRIDEDAASWGVLEKNNYIYKPSRNNDRIFELYSPEESVFLGKDYYYGINSEEMSQEEFAVDFNLGGNYKGDIKISLNDDKLRKCIRLSPASLSIIMDYAPKIFRASIKKDLDNCFTDRLENVLEMYASRVGTINAAFHVYRNREMVVGQVLLRARTEFVEAVNMLVKVNKEFSKAVTDYINSKINEANSSETPIDLFKISCIIRDYPLLKDITELADKLSNLIENDPGLDVKQHQLIEIIRGMSDNPNWDRELLKRAEQILGFTDQSYKTNFQSEGNKNNLNEYTNITNHISSDKADLILAYTRFGTGSSLFRDQLHSLLENKINTDDFISRLNGISGFSEMSDGEKRVKINNILNQLAK